MCAWGGRSEVGLPGVLGTRRICGVLAEELRGVLIRLKGVWGTEIIVRVWGAEEFGGPGRD